MTRENYTDFSKDSQKSALDLERAIISKASAGVQNLPMLDVIFARLQVDLSTALKTRANIITEAINLSISYIPWSTVLEDADPYTIYTTAYADPWAGSAILAMSPSFFFSSMEIQLSGTTTMESFPNRYPSTIEKRLAKNLASVIFDEISANFAHLTEVKFITESVENKQQIITQFAATTACARCDLSIKIGENIGVISIIIPLSTIEPIRPKLMKMFLGDKRGGDGTWREHIEKHLTDSTLTMEAHLASVEISLADIMKWMPGTTIDLGITNDDVEVALICGGAPFFYGNPGKTKANRKSVRVTREHTDPLEEKLQQDA